MAALQAHTFDRRFRRLVYGTERVENSSKEEDLYQRMRNVNTLKVYIDGRLDRSKTLLARADAVRGFASQGIDLGLSFIRGKDLNYQMYKNGKKFVPSSK